MQNRPRVLLIGAGGFGGVYVNALLKIGIGADLVGVCDSAPDIAERMPIFQEKDIPIYRDPESFFAADHADLVFISSPVHTHKRMALCAFAHGAHVLCEKPLCMTVEDAQEMMDAAKKAGRFLAVGYQLNYRRDVLALKQDILAGRFGKPKRFGIMHAYKRGSVYYGRNQWAGRILSNGVEVFDSPFSNACAHNFQMMSFLLGKEMHTCCELTKMDAELYRGNPNVENYDTFAARFMTTEGTEILYYTAHPIERDFGPKGIFEFEDATVTFDSANPSFKAKMKNGVVIDYSGVSPESAQSHQKMLDVVKAVHTGIAPVCGAETDLAHICAVRMAQTQPVVPVREELVSRVLDGENEFYEIKGLEGIFEECLQHFALPREMGIHLG